MKKIISAILTMLMFTSAAAAAPAPPPRPGGGPGPRPSQGPPPRMAPPRNAPKPGGPAPQRPAPNPGVRPGPQGPGHKPGGPVPPRPIQNPGGKPGPQGPGYRPGGQIPPRPGQPNPGVRPGPQGPGYRPGGPVPHHPEPGPMRPGPVVRPGHIPPPPPPPPRYYRYHYRHHWDDGWFAGGLGLGLLIGVLANSAESSAATQESYDQRAAEVRSAAIDTAQAQSAHVLQVIEQIGAIPALYELNEYWTSQGQTTRLETNAPVSSLKVSGFQGGLTIVYFIDQNLRTVTVTVTAPEYNVSESRSARYTEPAAGQYQTVPGAAYTAAPVPPGAAFDSLGFTLEEAARTAEGFLIIQKVQPATAAAYVGVRDGAVLYKIDGNSTAQVSLEQLCAYIERRTAAGAVAKITFSDGGKQKTANIKL